MSCTIKFLPNQLHIVKHQQSVSLAACFSPTSLPAPTRYDQAGTGQPGTSPSSGPGRKASSCSMAVLAVWAAADTGIAGLRDNSMRAMEAARGRHPPTTLSLRGAERRRAKSPSIPTKNASSPRGAEGRLPQLMTARPAEAAVEGSTASVGTETCTCEGSATSSTSAAH